ncbi:MAG: glycosyltransferase, partial [Clostridiales bacterium]|nr:glycosyltransferase [Clostridiales bacterium]
MKVIHLISGGDSGGAKTHVHSLLRHLSRRMDVTMVCFIDGPFAREARELGIRTEIVEGRRPLRALKRLRAMVAEEGYDIIHCHGSRGNMMGALLARSARLPLVTTVHSDYRLDYLGRPLSRLTYGTINALALRRMDYRIGVSDAMVDLLIARGFNPDRLFAIYNGLDFSPRPVAAPREAYLRAQGLHADGDCVVVGIAARLDAVKDVGTLIRGFAKAREACPQLRLLIAGEGGQGEELRALAARLIPQAGICRFTGWISDVDTFYNAIDINALTSLSETFPYALTEGARAGLPTVSSRVGGVPYLIDNGVNGLLFEPGDVETLARHLIALASDSALRAQMGGRLYRKAKAEFSLEATVARQMEIYETVLRRERRAKG